MAYRDLTETYKKIRTYYVRPVFGANVAHEEEEGADDLQYINKPKEYSHAALDQQPEWLHTINMVRDDMTDIKRKMAHLEELHKTHTTPRFGADFKAEESEIEILTEEIKRLFVNCKKAIERFETRAYKAEDLMKQNAKQSLANELHDLYKGFRASQRTYLTKMQTLKDRIKDLQPLSAEPDLSPEERVQIEELEQKMYDPGFNEEQINELIANTRDIMRRDREIREILQSIVELQELFREFSSLVIEQGTLLDRIDYNLDHTQVHLEVANTNLGDAIRYTGYSRWTICVLLLLVLLLGAVILIVLRIVLRFSGFKFLQILK